MAFESKTDKYNALVKIRRFLRNSTDTISQQLYRAQELEILKTPVFHKPLKKKKLRQKIDPNWKSNLTTV